ncbi:hypothetical protein LTR84_012156 [Exophiala bonariae]|uniref:Uncharacterized protein n=1 Tax=Exophiala bonariae TaxID=1690606 RepID=A0AAV9NFS6_9EURO|nr:hypothetical protein LTR84_012156 [Exophiala bonariae]
MSYTKGTWDTGAQIREHKLATSIINLHGTEDCVFDDMSLNLLKRFVLGRSEERRNEILSEREWLDEDGKPSSTALERDGSLVGYLIARYGTKDAALDDRDWELLDEWMVKGMPSGQNVQR